jgi:hypothetical protein
MHQTLEGLLGLEKVIEKYHQKQYLLELTACS